MSNITLSMLWLFSLRYTFSSVTPGLSHCWILAIHSQLLKCPSMKIAPPAASVSRFTSSIPSKTTRRLISSSVQW